MITEDYIMRLIRLASEFIVKALGLAGEGDFLESEKTLENGLMDLAGISLGTLVKVDAATLKSLTGGDDATVFVMARFLETLAEIELGKGKEDAYFGYLGKSLELYLDIERPEDFETRKPVVGIYGKIKGPGLNPDLCVRLARFAKTYGYHEMEREIGLFCDWAAMPDA